MHATHSKSGMLDWRKFWLGIWLFLSFCCISLLVAGCGGKSSPKARGEADEDPELVAMMEELQNPQRRMEEKRQTPLHIAAEDGKTNDVIRLLKEGAAVDARDRWNRTPLHLAAEWGHLGIVKALLASGADVNAQTKLGETALFFALRFWSDAASSSSSDWTALARTLISAGARYDFANNSGLTPLHLAAGAKNGTPEIVEVLIKGGADVNAAEEFGDTVLHFSASREKADNTKLLLAAGANVNARGRGGYTPLHSAAFEGDASVVKLLVDAKADVNARDENGETPLHHPAPFGESAWINVLLQEGARVNEKSLEGQTPIHKAAGAGRADIIRLLLDGGAEINATDNDGRTPLDMTLRPEWPIPEGRMNACIALLKDKGGTNGTNRNAK